MKKTCIIMAFVFMLMACNTALVESPAPVPLPKFRDWQQQPWDIGATSKDSVVAEFNSEGTLVIRGKGNMMDFEIIRPWDAMCNEKDKLIKVVIESGVTHIGDWAFRNCSYLSSISISNSVASIGKLAFWSSGLASVTIPNSVISIGDYAFHSCKKLTSIAIPGKVTSIGKEVFSGGESLETIIVASDNKTYSSKDGVLYDKNFSTLIQYPGGKSKIVTIPDGVISIGEGAFSYGNLSSVTIPNSVTSIGKGAFSHSNLDSISIPGSVTSIGERAFSHSNLSSITIPSGVTSIEDNTFYNCKKLTSATIPSSVTSIGEEAFSKSNLKSMTILNPTPPSLPFDTTLKSLKSTFMLYYAKDCILYVPDSSVDAYSKADGWKNLGFKKIKPISSTPEPLSDSDWLED